MKRSIKFALVLYIVLVAFTVTHGETTCPKVYLNNTNVVYTNDSGYPYVNDDGNIMVPFVKTLKDFKADVIEFKKIKVIIARRGKKGGSELGCCLEGDNKLKFNYDYLKDENDNYVICETKDDIPYFPAKPVFKAYGCKYNYDSQSNTLYISYKEDKKFDILGPKYSKKNTEEIQFVTDENCTIYEGYTKPKDNKTKPLELSADKKMTIQVGKEYGFVALYPDGDFKMSFIEIKKEATKNFLNVDSNRFGDSMHITGKTKHDSKVTINGKEYPVKKSKFSCHIELTEGDHKVRIRSYDAKTNKYIQETIEYSYNPKEDEDDEEEDKKPDPNLISSNKTNGVETVQYKRYKRDNSNTDSTNELPSPVIHFDKLTLRTTDKVIKISGYVEHANYVVINAGKGTRTKVEGTYGEKIKFNHIATLWTKDDSEAYITPEGVETFFQVFARNDDKDTVIEGDILLIEGE